MARQRFVWVDGRGLVEVPPDWRPPPRAFAIISDAHEPFQSQASGRWFDSKSAYRRELKALGYEETGNEVPRPPEFKPNDWTQDLCETAAEMGVGNVDEIKVGDVIDGA